MLEVDSNASTASAHVVEVYRKGIEDDESFMRHWINTPKRCFFKLDVVESQRFQAAGVADKGLQLQHIRKAATDETQTPKRGELDCAMEGI
jgi:hypothetical protein